eukprot:247674-Amphidinium_carterae.1
MMLKLSSNFIAQQVDRALSSSSYSAKSTHVAQWESPCTQRLKQGVCKDAGAQAFCSCCLDVLVCSGASQRCH